MLGNIWISSALIVVAIFSAGALWKSISDIKEAKQIQEHYEIVKDIKTQIALKYNTNPENLTRDDIIAHLPKGENWEKILLLDRQKDSNLDNKEFINQEANITINEDEKLKLLALKAKLKNSIDTNNLQKDGDSFKIKIAQEVKSSIENDKIINKSIENAVSYLYSQILTTINDNSKSQTEIQTIVDSLRELFEDELEKTREENNIFVPFDYINLDFGDNLTDTQKESKKIEFFKAKVKERIELNSSGYEQGAVEYLKGRIE